MASTSTYINFPGTTEAAFTFYKEVFGTDYLGPVMRMGDGPPAPGAPPLTEEQQRLVMHVALPITGGHVLMGTDAVESMGHPLTMGNNISLSVDTDTRAEADRLFAGLAAGGTVGMPLQEMFWGAYWGHLTDRFGMKWMVSSRGQ